MRKSSQGGNAKVQGGNTTQLTYHIHQWFLTYHSVNLSKQCTRPTWLFYQQCSLLPFTD